MLRRWLFVVLWLATTCVLGWQLAQGVRDFDAGALPGLPLMLALTVALIWWLPGPAAPPAQDRPAGRRGRFLLAALGLLLALILVSAAFGPSLLFGIMALAAAVLLWLRPSLDRREIRYVTVLAIVAAVAALPMSAAKFPVWLWAAMQLGLVVLCLLAGWALMRRHGLLQAGLGRSLFLSDGWRPALIGALQGALLALPWALLNPLMGGSNNDAWVTSWWHPLAAFQPGIAEEAWGRVLPVPLIYLVLRRYTGERSALTAAVLAAGYWFAFLHTGRTFDISTLISTLMIGTLYALPVCYLWLRRGLETAMGFHVAVDSFRWVVAYLINTGVWLS